MLPSLFLALASAAPAAAAAGAGKPHPPPPPETPAGISFNSSFGSMMVLQQAPAKACVVGMLGDGGTAATVKIAAAADPSFAAYEVEAEIIGAGPAFKSCLAPQKAGGDFTITATCTGCVNTTVAVMTQVTYGDVWYCGGQSNMVKSPISSSFSILSNNG